MQVIATGGKAIYGAPLGILMLEARFPRIPGDMGNAATWPFPVLYRVVRGATPGTRGAERRRRAAGRLPGRRRRTGARRRRGDHHQLRLPLAVPGGAGGPCAGAGRHQRADPGALGAGDAAARPPRRHHHGFRRARSPRGIWQPPACRRTRRSSAPRTAASSSACWSAARSRTWTWRWPRPTFWMPAGRWCRAIPTSAPSCWNAPTCRPTRSRCARRWGCRSTTSTR